MPIARPVASRTTGDPELPPVVSAVYCKAVGGLRLTNAPVCVFWTWLQVGEIGDEVTPYPVMRVTWLLGCGATAATVYAACWTNRGAWLVTELGAVKNCAASRPTPRPPLLWM